MKVIPVSRNLLALLDDEDYELISKWKWSALPGKNTFYARRLVAVRGTGKRKNILMHRLVTNVGDDKEVDHRDGNGLNNQKSNLRICNPSQNSQNCQRYKNNTSGVKGVSFRKDRGVWVAEITCSGKKYYLGYFQNINDALLAYNNAAKQLHGEFAKPNPE